MFCHFKPPSTAQERKRVWKSCKQEVSFLLRRSVWLTFRVLRKHSLVFDGRTFRTTCKLLYKAPDKKKKIYKWCLKMLIHWFYLVFCCAVFQELNWTGFITTNAIINYLFWFATYQFLFWFMSIFYVKMQTQTGLNVNRVKHMVLLILNDAHMCTVLSHFGQLSYEKLKFKI